MKAICTSYTQTDKGLVLRNNWIDEIKDLVHLDNYLKDFISDEEVQYIVSSIRRALEKGEFKISSIIEGKMSLDNVVIHIRIIA